ncbi:hypothetical protein BDY19DRAFT_928320 [Irpex rosettiformis]|uniref:Uncharacterized protein n=1 Tax=Irpex rosettiformis TaxID=378272 RepID=A0ACB8UDS0_9APHY|nr:hypothetical protein BDY19DRAFT_928320 [Irpex rosettiformis]
MDRLGLQTSRNLLVMDPLSTLHSCDAQRPPMILEIPMVPTSDRPVFSPPLAPLTSSVPTVMSSHILNSGSLFLGLFTVFSLLAWKARTGRKMIMKVNEESIPSTPARNATQYLTTSQAESDGSLYNNSSDLDDTFDEPSLLSPTSSGYFTTPSSPKMLTTSELPSPMSLSIDSQETSYCNGFKVTTLGCQAPRTSYSRSSVLETLGLWLS